MIYDDQDDMDFPSRNGTALDKASVGYYCRSAMWSVSRAILSKVGLITLSTLAISMSALLAFDILFEHWSTPEDVGALRTHDDDGWLIDGTDISKSAKEFMESISNSPRDDFPPLVTGMYHSDIPMYYVGDAQHPLRDALMELGFSPVGNLTRVQYLSSTESAEEVARRLGFKGGVDALKKYMNDLGTNLTELIFFQNYLTTLSVAAASQAPIVTVFYNDISPAVSVFWDADYDQYVNVIQDYQAASTGIASEEDRNRDSPAESSKNFDWDVVITSYNYPDRKVFERYYNTWRDNLPRSRAIPLNLDYRDPLASIWTRKGIDKILNIFSTGEKLPQNFNAFLNETDHMLFDCAKRPAEIKSCSIPAILTEVFKPKDGKIENNSAWLLQPPIFAKRPIPEDTLVTGWKTGKDPEFVSLQQSVADTFKWVVENCEVFEGLHAYMLMTEDEQQAIYEEAKNRYTSFVEKGEIPGDKAQLMKKLDDVPYMLAWRLQSFFPRALWIPDL